MLKLACLNKKFEVSDIEILKSITSKEKSYTVNTLKKLFNTSDSTYFFILGTDALSRLSDWYKWTEIIKYSHLIFVERQGSLLKDSLSKEIINFIKQHKANSIIDLKEKRSGLIYQVKMNFMNISSSEIVDKNITVKKIDKIINVFLFILRKLFNLTTKS